MKFKYYVLPVILGAVLLGSAANACSPTTLAYLQGKQATMLVSPNGRYLLRNIPGMWAKEKGKLVLKRAPYSLASGLLKNGQLKPLWSMKVGFRENYVRDRYKQVYLSNDGLTLLTLENVIDQNSRAASLYRKGKKLRSYRSIDFGITDSMLQRNQCDLPGWIHKKADSIEQSGNQISIRTVDGKKHTINLLSGVKTN